MRLRKWFASVIVMLILLVAAFLYARIGSHEHGRAEKVEVVIPATIDGAQRPDSNADSTHGGLPEPRNPKSTEVGNEGHEELMDFTDLSSEMNGQGSIAASFFGLSRQEAAWMDAQGAWQKDEANFEPYANLSLDELVMRAQQGDVTAAVYGAQKCRLMALSKLDKPAREALMHGTDDDKRRVAEELFANELWNKQRELLWDGVTYGSSIAADLMSQSYTTLLGSTCSSGGEYTAWALVSWRMGNWNVIPPSCNDAVSGLAGSLELANQLWDRINYLRAEKGLGPLPLNLRPNHAEWLQLRLDPRKKVPVYRR